MSMPLSLILKDMLGYCKTSKEVRALLRDKEILVDGKRKKEEKELVSVMDVFSIPLTKDHFRMQINRHNKLMLVKIEAEEAGMKILKIMGKTTLKEGKMQLNLFDGRCIIVKEKNYKIGDSVGLKLPSQEITEHLKMEKGAYVYVTEGGHTGYHGVVEDITSDGVKIKAHDAEFITPKKTVFVIGKHNPQIKMYD
jgi:small subunit ribosomal protein S4e